MGEKLETNRVMANEEPKAGDINSGRLLADSKAYRRKRAEIAKASRKGDVELLAKLATSEGGLLEDDIRKQVCKIGACSVFLHFFADGLTKCFLSGPILQGYVRATHTLELPPLSELPCHGDEDQVKLDVDRSFVYYPNCKFVNVDTCLRRVYPGRCTNIILQIRQRNISRIKEMNS